MTLDWLIIGGGIHGVHIATRMLGEAGIAAKKIRIVDPGNRLLDRWRACTAITGMSHLRSPSVHHLDLSPWSLRRFVGKRKSWKPGIFAPPYDRPALSLFNAHCNQVMEAFGLANIHIQDRATSCSVDCDGASVRLSSGSKITAHNLVLAIGASEQPEWPDWAPRENTCVHHIFDPKFDGWPTSNETIAVVGGGISAGQLALRLLKEGHQVHLISRHALRQHQFDSDPGWLGPRFMASFNRERDLNRRRAMISKARHRGSVPPDIQRALRRAIKRKQLYWHESEVDDCNMWCDGLELQLATNTVVEAKRVLLATGFASCRPGGSMVDTLITSASLPCARCGYPVVDSVLRWHPRVYVSGPLAELELGPTARNIAGARRAGDRLVDAVQKGISICS